uniref:hypothetical protein n=1 Tax=uncultured Sphingomonas sp. TaxID=158754 RepID=UPI0025E323F9|nr:hypothetical protein [uncultured Sphingomonas sp.]
MRKYLIAAVVATSALTAAAPAAAQYYPAPQPYGYGYPQPNYGYGQPRQPNYGYGQPNYGYGYQQPYGYGHNQQGLVRSYMARVDQLLYRIDRLDGRDRISEREARALRNEALNLRQRIARSGYNGLNGRERQNIEYRLAYLQDRVRHERRDRDGRVDRGDRDGRDGRWIDRDRDGRNDRYEDDGGRYPG